MSGLRDWIAQLAHAEAQQRKEAAAELYREGRALGDAVVDGWRRDPAFAGLLAGEPTVGIAVSPETFARIRAAAGSPRLAEVPSDQDVQEFELHLGETRLDILTTRTGAGAIARFLEKQGEGIQQVEYPVTDVDCATNIVGQRFGLTPVYSAKRPGADGTQVNFFLAATPEGKKVLIELVEAPQPPS